MCRRAAVKRTRHIQDSQGQIPALNSSRKSAKPFMMFPLRSEALGRAERTPQARWEARRTTPAGVCVCERERCVRV